MISKWWHRCDTKDSLETEARHLRWNDRISYAAVNSVADAADYQDNNDDYVEKTRDLESALVDLILKKNRWV